MKNRRRGRLFLNPAALRHAFTRFFRCGFGNFYRPRMFWTPGSHEVNASLCPALRFTFSSRETIYKRLTHSGLMDGQLDGPL